MVYCERSSGASVTGTPPGPIRRGSGACRGGLRAVVCVAGARGAGPPEPESPEQDEAVALPYRSVDPELENCAEWLASRSRLISRRVSRDLLRAISAVFRDHRAVPRTTFASYGPSRLNAVLAATAAEGAVGAPLATRVQRSGGLPGRARWCRSSAARYGALGATKSPRPSSRGAETMALIARSRTGPPRGGPRRSRRARFLVATKPSLRPHSPTNWRRPITIGHSAVLRIRNPADNNAYGRSLPLTYAAYEALESVCPTQG
jgi:hypothetical protein